MFVDPYFYQVLDPSVLHRSLPYLQPPKVAVGDMGQHNVVTHVPSELRLSIAGRSVLRESREGRGARAFSRRALGQSAGFSRLRTALLKALLGVCVRDIRSVADPGQGELPPFVDRGHGMRGLSARACPYHPESTRGFGVHLRVPSRGLDPTIVAPRTVRNGFLKT